MALASKASRLQLVLLITLAASSAVATSQQSGSWNFWGLLNSRNSASGSSGGSTEKRAPSAGLSDGDGASSSARARDREYSCGGKTKGPDTSQRCIRQECFSSVHGASKARLDLEGLSHLADSGQKPALQLLKRVKAASPLHSGLDAGSGAGAIPQERSGVPLASSVQGERRHTCWEAAYVDLVASCRDILSNETKKAELALRLTNCYLVTSGRDVITCPAAFEGTSGSLKACLASLTDHQHLVYLAYFIDCPSICHYLQANTWKKDVEELVNDLRSTAAGVQTMLAMMAGQTDEILARTEKTLQAQEALQEQQAAARAAAELVNSHLGDLQGSLQSFGIRQESLGQEVLNSLSRLGEGTKEMRENVFESLQRQKHMEASQEAAASALERLHSGQRYLAAQQTTDHERLKLLAEEHHRRTAAWHGEVQGAQDRILEGQGRVEEELRRTGEQHAAAFQEQTRAMDEVAQRTIQYHTETVQWQQQMQGVQSRLLMGQSEVAEALSDAAQDALRHREVEREWNRQTEAYHRDQAAEMIQMKRVTDEFREDHKTGLRSMERLLSFMGAMYSHLGFISAVIFYGIAAGLSLLLTSTARTSAARLPLLLMAVVAGLLEWGLHTWVASLATSAYLDTATLLKETLPVLVSALRWVYGFLSSAIWVSYASTYRNLVQASHSLLERQTAHFQGLLLALQEVAHHFRLQEQQQGQQPRPQPGWPPGQPHVWQGIGAWEAQGQVHQHEQSTVGGHRLLEEAAAGPRYTSATSGHRPAYQVYSSPPAPNLLGSVYRGPASPRARQAAHRSDPLEHRRPASPSARQAAHRLEPLAHRRPAPSSGGQAAHRLEPLMGHGGPASTGPRQPACRGELEGAGTGVYRRHASGLTSQPAPGGEGGVYRGLASGSGVVLGEELGGDCSLLNEECDEWEEGSSGGEEGEQGERREERGEH